jgi:alpha-galactosidase
MKLSYNYFSPLNLVVRHVNTLKANKQGKSGQIKNKHSIPKHLIAKRAQSASNNREPARLKRKFKQAGGDETFQLLASGGECKDLAGLDEVTDKGLEVEKKSELEEIFKTRRNSIKDEIKTIFEEDTTKNSCMVQTEEMIQVEKPQPSLLNYIHKSRTASRVQVSRDLSCSLSIKKYKKPEKLTKSTRFFLCKENQPGKFNQSLDNAVKDNILTPTSL